MSNHKLPRAIQGPDVVITSHGSRKSSDVSTTQSPVTLDNQHLRQSLDRIHNDASQSETLTTFNEFASPPSSARTPETKGLAGEIMNIGLTGIYNRFKGAVGTARDKPKTEKDSIDGGSIKSHDTATISSQSSLVLRTDEAAAAKYSVQPSRASSRIQSPTTSPFPTYDEALPENNDLLRIASNPKSSSSTTSVDAKSSKGTTNTAPPPLTPRVDPISVSAMKHDSANTANSIRNSLEYEDNQAIAASIAKSLESENSQALSSLGRTIRGSKRESPETRAHEVSDTRIAMDADQLHGDESSALNAGRRDRVAYSVDGGVDAIETGEKKQDVHKNAKHVTIAQAATAQDLQSRPAPLRHITQSRLPGFHRSRSSSTDLSMSMASIADSSMEFESQLDPSNRDHGTSMSALKLQHAMAAHHESAPLVNSRLEQMRRQVLSKEFWMADDICKECFLCGDTFTAFRRKHHCRTCGCIFDAKCTSIISGQKFGVQGSLRICKTCVDIINRRHDSSGSEESENESTLPSFFEKQKLKLQSIGANGLKNAAAHNVAGTADSERLLATPMMAIPATRGVGDNPRRSAILEFDASHLARPSSSRSLRALSTATRPISSGHRRNQSKHSILAKLKNATDERAPFHRGGTEYPRRGSQLPAFHDDNIIDPDLAPYLSDEGSSGEEQSIFSTLASTSRGSPSFENDRIGFGSLLNVGKKHRSRSDKSLNSAVLSGRGNDDNSQSPSTTTFSRPSRRRNLSLTSNTVSHSKPSPLHLQSTNLATTPEPKGGESSPATGRASILSTRMTRSISMRDAKAPAIELNSASLAHVKRLLQQLLDDAQIPNASAWERALVPILLQCTDDVNPSVRRGDDIDIRHYVKVKKIPGGRPSDTAYVSGIVFSKNLALKTMPRTISHPRIVIVSFPIEYQRHQRGQHFQSLQPVIAQEKEFLKNMVNRLASLRPSLLLVQKNIAGLALQYLAEANIAVAYNVKQSVIEAVSRFAQTEIISSIDMVALKPVHVGRSAGFDVKTYVHRDIPGRKKTYIYLSGCPKELGCTIALRGASLPTLTKMKHITEFMVYVVYNLKLETCLMRDEFILIPSVTESNGSMSSMKPSSLLPPSQIGTPVPAKGTVAPAGSEVQDKTGARNDGSPCFDISSSSNDLVQKPSFEISQLSLTDNASGLAVKDPKMISAHASHMHAGHNDEQLPDDIPMPTFYSDMVAKYQTKILSASPFVKFLQPYLLMKAREQERRLTYLRRLRDQDSYEEQAESDSIKAQKFQLIRPEMVHETVKKAPKQIMEVLHAVHDAEFDKAMHNYQTQTRQWENMIQVNLDLFDPFYHQGITVLYTVVCTQTTIPCYGPELLTLAFYNEHESGPSLDPDCTLGQYVEDLCLGANTLCTSNSCERKMSEHHRTYVHGEARVTVILEESPCKLSGLEDSILMWSFCKICKKETNVIPMSESTWKYSFGKYLELSFWSSPLRIRAGFCSHDQRTDHLKYFGFRDMALRIHYDPIDLLEIVVPRTRITWKVDNDLRLKNDLFTKIEERWTHFMASVNSRIKGINIDSVAPEKVQACKAQIDLLTKRAHDEHASEIRKLQDKYMDSKYYEIVPLNRCVRSMQEKVAGWDDAFAEFDSNFFPSEKDIRRLAALQLRKMFMDRDGSASSLLPSEGDVEEKADSKLLVSVSDSEDGHSMPSVHDPQEVFSPIAVDGKDAVAMTSFSPVSPGDMSKRPAESLSNPMERLNLPTMQHLDLAVDQHVPDQMTDSAVTTGDTSTAGSPADTGLEMAVPYTLEPTLSQKVEQLRQAHLNESADPLATSQPTVSQIPRPSERDSSRRVGSRASSPPLTRTQSQPSVAFRRLQPLGAFTKASDITNEVPPDLRRSLNATDQPSKASDKKLTERLVLGSIKIGRKSGHSLIPRSVQGSKRKDSKVSTLAKHFELLSREFEKERLRDRKQRAAKTTQSRALPKFSSKPIVEVYKDIQEAVEERDVRHSDPPAELIRAETAPGPIVGGLAELNVGATAGNAAPHSPEDLIQTNEETMTDVETDHNQSQTNSDDEGDADNSLIEAMIPGIEEIAEKLDRPEAEMSMVLPKHERSSLMKMLTNFWAERSASGWTSLDYLLNATDHIFVDSDVIVREDEPSSLIAFTLASEDYKQKLSSLRHQGGPTNKRQPDSTAFDKSVPSLEPIGDHLDQTEVETSLLRATGTHLAYSFAESSARMQCKIFFAEQFDAVRRKCGVADRIVESLSRCLKWDSKGGKTKSVFLKTLDDRLILKSLSPIETQAFLRFAPAYFNIMAEALFHDLPTVIAKMLGFFQISIKNPMTGTEIKWDVLVMENLFYDRSPTRIFDLKGSMRNRKIQSTGEQNEVLLDENMVEFIYESPLFAREHSKKLLRAAIFNDTLFLQRNDVMDYSLMVAVDDVSEQCYLRIACVLTCFRLGKSSWLASSTSSGHTHGYV